MNIGKSRIGRLSALLESQTVGAVTAILAVALSGLLTYVLLTGLPGLTSEANPVADLLIEYGGWSAFAAVRLATVGVALLAFRKRGETWAAWTLAGVASLDAVWDAYVFAVAPEFTVALDELAAVAVVTAVGAVGAIVLAVPAARPRVPSIQPGDWNVSEKSRQAATLLFTFVLISSLTISGVGPLQSSNPVGTASAGTLDWEFATGGTTVATAVAPDKGYAFFGTSGGTIYKVDLSDGSEISNVTVGGLYYDGLDFHNGSLYAGDQSSGDVYVYDGDTMSQSNSVNAGGAIYGLEVGSSGHVYVADNANTQIIKLNPDLTQEWANPLSSAVSVGVDEDSNLVVGGGGDVIAWDLNGNQEFTHTPSGIAYGVDALNGDAYAGTDNGYLRKHDKTGSVLWNKSDAGDISGVASNSNLNTTFVSDDSGGYLGYNEDGSLAFSDSTGTFERAVDGFEESGNVKFLGASRGENRGVKVTTSVSLTSSVSGTVVDSSGNPIENASVEIDDQADGSTVFSDTTNSTGDWSTDLGDGDYNVTADASGYNPNSKTFSVAGSAVTVDLTLSKNPVTGEVVDQNGNAVKNATVEVWGVNYDHPDVNDTQDAYDELRATAERIPTEWTDDLPLKGPSGHFETADTNYAAVTMTTVEGDPWLDSADLGSPQLTVPANEPLVLTEWTADTSLTSALDEYDQQLPGKTVDDGAIVVEEFDGKDDIVNRETYELDEQAGGGFLDPSSLAYNETELQPGYYRIYPEGSPETSYVIQVGSTQEIIETLDANLTTPDGLPSEAAQQAQSKLDDNLFERTTVTTNSTGHFSTEVPTNVKTVGIQAYKAGGMLEGTTNPSIEDVRTIAESDYNGSVVISTGPEIVDTPAEGVTVSVYEFSTPPFYNLSAFDNRTEWLRNLLEETSYSDLPPALQQSLENASDEEIDELHSELQDLRWENDRLNDRYQELADEDDTRTDEIRKLQQALTELRTTIESGTPETSRTEDAVSVTFPFSTNLEPRQVAVLVHHDNGTTETLSPENSSYVSINERIGGDEVVVEDYPMPADSAIAQFEVQVANSDGIGHADERVENPAFDGEIPSLDSISLSTLRPATDETVSMTMHPRDDAQFRQLDDVTVYGPSGGTVPAAVVDGTSGEFETSDGPGRYHVRATFTNLDGKEFTQVFQVKAGETRYDMPGAVRTVDSPLGIFALTGDDVERGAVRVEDGGSDVMVTANVATPEDVPRNLHVYTSGLSLPADTTLNVQVTHGSDDKAVSQHVRVTAHLESLPDGATLYRNGDALPRDGENTYARVNQSPDSLTIETYTDDQGRLELKTVSSPGLIERLRYQVSLRLQGVDLPLAMITASDATAAGGTLLPVAVVLGAIVGRRRLD